MNSQLSTEELVQLCAIDSTLFESTFFPKTVRQAPALYHPQLWALLDSHNRFVNIQVHRDGAKTTKLRIYTAKRIAYGLARVVLYIGKSEGHAVRSVGWIRRQIEHNAYFARTFNLRPGKTWKDGQAEVWQGTDEYPVTVLGVGITGSIRGINFDDYRPDLIIVDDVIDDENAGTPDQRKKIEDLLLSAVKNSLAPRSESPDAKMVMLQTPLSKEDASTKALNDPEWVSAVYGCWTQETKDLPLEQQMSSWPARFPTEELREEKRYAISRNKLSLFLREKECKLTSPETSAFLPTWVKYYREDIGRNGVTIIAIDPVPPPSDLQISKGLAGKDYESFAVVTKWRGIYFVREVVSNRGHQPDWTVMTFFRLCIKYNPRYVMVEGIAYQKTLEWILSQAMKAKRMYYLVKTFADKRSKHDRIVDALNGPASEGVLMFKEEMTTVVTQFLEYPDVPNEDELEAVAVAVQELQNPYILSGDSESDQSQEAETMAQILESEKDIPELEYHGGAP